MSGTSEPADNPESGDDAEPQDVRTRFREALERKQAKAKSRESHADGTSKIHDAHGPAAGRRVFRRKSG